MAHRQRPFERTWSFVSWLQRFGLAVLGATPALVGIPTPESVLRPSHRQTQAGTFERTFDTPVSCTFYTREELLRRLTPSIRQAHRLTWTAVGQLYSDLLRLYTAILAADPRAFDSLDDLGCLG